MKNIAIIGYGYVGEAMTRFFKDHYNVMVKDVMTIPKSRKYDKVKYLSKGDSSYRTINKEADMVILCVPTPMSNDGSVCLTYLEDVLSKLQDKLVLIKSTVPPKTTQMLNNKYENELVFSPEYLGESKYVTQWWKGSPHPTDLKKQDFQIFGGIGYITSEVIQFFKPILGPEAKYLQTDWATAELCKYMENSWGATKVIFCNEFARIAEELDVDYDELRELWLLDGRINRNHTAVFEDKRGFGGKCFPKDINGIVKQAENNGYTPKLLKTVIEVNQDLQ